MKCAKKLKNQNYGLEDLRTTLQLLLMEFFWVRYVNSCKKHYLSCRPGVGGWDRLVLFSIDGPFHQHQEAGGLQKKPILFGTELQLKNQVKYLGVILDVKHNWNSHIDYRMQKTTIAFWQCRRAIGKTWGLKPKIVYWYCTGVLVYTLRWLDHFDLRWVFLCTWLTCYGPLNRGICNSRLFWLLSEREHAQHDDLYMFW
jgi:hypothetical protein